MHPQHSSGSAWPSPETPEPCTPVLVVGTPRSGTTWVEQVLGRTPGAHVVHEPDNETCDPFALPAKVYLGRFPVLGAEDVAPPEYVDLWNRAFAGRLHRNGPRWLTAKVLLKSAGPDLDAALDQSIRRLSPRLRLMTALAPVPTSSRRSPQVVVKSVHACLAVEWIARRYHPTVLVVRRHPLSVVASYVELGWRDSGLHRHPLLQPGASPWPWVPPLPDGASPVARIAWQVGLFTSALESALERNPHWHAVSHEALCREPEAVFRSLCTALELPWQPAATEFLAASNRPGTGLTTYRVAADQPGAWRRRLSPGQIEEAAAVLSRFPASAGRAADSVR